MQQAAKKDEFGLEEILTDGGQQCSGINHNSNPQFLQLAAFIKTRLIFYFAGKIKDKARFYFTAQGEYQNPQAF
ncbi:MAG: hypothetical protein ACI8WB_000569 [Phenylobacterium sp.]|jgi:hypothetical protein